jgi:hypothetical protein
MPTGLGLMLETIRTTGLHNMITEFDKAFVEAICLGVYLGQLTHKDVTNTISKSRDIAREYWSVYHCKVYYEHVTTMAPAIPYSNLYEKTFKSKIVEPATKVSTIELCIEKALKACLKKGQFARDVAELDQAQTIDENELRLIGAQLW